MTSRHISRKEFLGIGAGAAAGVALAGSGMATLLTKKALAATPALTPFLDELPIPSVLTGASLSLAIRQTTQKFHTALPPAPVWGYNGGGYSGYLGPTIEAVKGTPTSVSYLNDLPLEHLLEQEPSVGQTRILTHLHGGHISDAADGNPYATPVESLFGQTQTVEYANDQEAAHIWYHDHALGITRLNVMAGLAGHYLVRDEVDNGQGGKLPQ
jgi:spore coat protein A, manganese oxidase